MNKRIEQKEKRRQDILSAALDLFIHKGFAATKVVDIANKVNMSVGLLFHYFNSKEHLYEELVRLGLSGPESVMSNDKSDPLTFFETTAKQILKYASKDPLTAKMFLLMKQVQYNDAAPDSVKLMLKGLDTISQTVLLIEAGQQNGTLREGNPMALSIAYWAAIQGVCEELAINPDLPCPESTWIVDMIRRR
ncbi:MAG: transcriptional regulator, TetR family [Herbinix sp.]|jgi:AcrR family transcriptional regulator|nr:transcriptional regulator, TetR family [Herbinix sp.]